MARSSMIDILWDGDVLLAVDKPAGLPTQAPPSAESLETRLRQQLSSRSGYLALPHRLDRLVSGVILVALSKKAARLINEQFECRKIDKEYHALVQGRYDADQTRWSDFVWKIPDQARVEISDSANPMAKLAETRVSMVSYDRSADRTALKLFPETGRTHQLRVQAANHGHPIVGDTLYGGRPLGESDGFDQRIFLHAHSISFYDPRNGVATTVTASGFLEQSV